MKDSYAALDLKPLGFQMLFDAHWLWLAPADLSPSGLDIELAWTRIDTNIRLAEWEQAWSGASQNLDGKPARQFPNALLRNPDFAFFAGRSQGRIVAGGVVNRSPGAAGLSNLFVRTERPDSIWPALVRLARETFPGLPLVGYERGDELQRAQRAGFVTIGDLRVWHRPATQ